jgi:hypothetical protein
MMQVLSASTWVAEEGPRRHLGRAPHRCNGRYSVAGVFPVQSPPSLWGARVSVLAAASAAPSFAVARALASVAFD